MKITETNLRQIVSEEVHLRLIEYYIDQEIEALLTEDEKEDWDAAKWKARKKKLSNAALGALGMGTTFGGLKRASDQYSDAKSAHTAVQVAQNQADSQSLAQKKIELETYMNNPAAFRWGVGKLFGYSASAP